MIEAQMRDALDRYKLQVSILKKGYETECYRIARLIDSPLCHGGRTVRSVKAQRLVRKLEGQKHKGRQATLPSTAVVAPC